MLMTRFIWQTVLKPLSVTDAKNGANTPSLIPTMEAGHYSIQVGAVNMERYNQFIEASRSSLGVVLGDLVDVGTWGVGGWGGVGGGGGEGVVFL
jgi:hypothetical protein